MGEHEDPVSRALARAHGILPDQGPIGVFIHHNTLHAFQHLPFHEGVQQGSALIGARPYLDVHEYRAAWANGRIEDQDAIAAIRRVLGDRADDGVAFGVTRGALWLALLRDVLDEDDEAGLRFLHEHGAAGLHGAECVAAARERIERGPPGAAVERTRPARHRDALVALGATDTDVGVHGELVRLCAVFLDHGQALAEMPHRQEGFLPAVASLFAAGGTEPALCRGVHDDMERFQRDGRSARDVIHESLAALGVHGDAVEPFLLATALALPGWTGMFSRLERHPEEREGPTIVTLADVVAVRLAYERRAVETVCRQSGLPVDWRALQEQASAVRPRSTWHDAWTLAGVARSAGAGPDSVRTLSDGGLRDFWADADALPRLQRRRLMHDAYERRYRRWILDAMDALRPEIPPDASERPDAQFVFCIDEREESVRRALEELSPTFETFGVAGFFGVAIDYMGLYDDSPAAYCPVVVTPAHEVHESVRPAERHWHIKRSGLRDRWNAAQRLVHRQSRTLSGGAGLSLLLGPMAAALALSRIIAPRTSLAVAESARERWAPRPGTQLSALRDPATDARSERGKFVGFTLDETADRVAGVLRAIGLLDRFAPVVFILGHGSTSLNNPHESAHDCGACGGRRGGTNARLFAEMANSPAVRAALIARGVHIPDSTWFIGGLHDTADDAVTLYDLEFLPVGHADAFQRAHDGLDAARRESAAERCRRFADAPLGITPDAALRHVQGRASHLAQPRPEYGHCTNAICIVGRRSISRGLHLDRRAFLVSYDPRQDRESATLERILAAVGPVGAGISLEYYFSSVDNERYGCGTKLPHNVTGLVGVMAGHQSDLRTGLPLQMVEIHEPMRLLLIVDATPESLLAVAGRQAEVAELVVKEWVQLVSRDPDTGRMVVFEDGGFVPYTPAAITLPRVERSRDWHMRGRQHFPPALVQSALVGSAHSSTGRARA
jgi:uncharacterized protein YbcC (UPF0753/DUF2309 family)